MKTDTRPDLTLMNRLVKEVNDLQASQKTGQDLLVDVSKAIGVLTALSKEAALLINDHMVFLDVLAKTKPADPMADLLPTKIKN